MNRIYLIALITILLLKSNTIIAQDGQYVEVRDLETWSAVELKYKINKKWSMALESQLRLDKNSSELNNYLTEFTTKYKWSKHFALGLGLRYINENDTEGNIQGIRHYFRYHLDAIVKHDINRLDFKYRFRYQNKNELGISQLEGDVPVNNFRFKTSVDYNIKSWKLDPEISGEIFNKYEQNGQTNGFNKFRITAGTSYKFKKAGKLGLYYRLDQEIDSDYPKTSNIILLNYSYSF